MVVVLSQFPRRAFALIRRRIERLQQLAKRSLRDLPYGERLVVAMMKHRLRAGRSPELSGSDEIGKYFDFAIVDLTEARPGPLGYFEAGVYAGNSMATWYHRCQAADVTTAMFGADSFAGLPDSANDDEASWFAGQFYCPLEVTEWNLRRLGVPTNEACLIKGWFEESLTPRLADEVGSVDVAMLDADTYMSTVPVLKFLGPLLADRAWLIFNDWYSGGNLDAATGKTKGIGVEQAFNEWHASEGARWGAVPIGDYEFEIENGNRRLAGHVMRLALLAEPGSHRLRRT